jgi:hypothetical protein
MTTKIGVFESNIFICVVLLIGTVLTAFIKPDYRRQNAVKPTLKIIDSSSL